MPIISQNNCTKLSNINWQTFQGEELNVFDSILTRKNILIISEPDHGYGSSYEVQCGVLKRLIDSGKIASLYIESSWINCEKIVSTLNDKGKDGIDEAKKYIRSYDLKYWTYNGFWDYLTNKIIEGKVKLFGFDIDGISPTLVKGLFNEALLLKPVQDFMRIDTAAFNNEGWGANSVLYRKSYDNISYFISLVTNWYEKQSATQVISQWKSILNFFYWMYRRSIIIQGNEYSNQIANNKQFSSYHKVRDSLMAGIFLDYFQKERPGAKVVCLMSSYHALRNSKSIEYLGDCCKDDSISTMTEILDRKLSEQIYNTSFITFSGEYGISDYGSSNYRKVKKPIRKSLEDCINDFKIPFCFVELQQPDLRSTSFYMRVVFHRFLRSKWSENFSGIFFIRTMRPLLLKKQL